MCLVCVFWEDGSVWRVHTDTFFELWITLWISLIWPNSVVCCRHCVLPWKLQMLHPVASSNLSTSSIRFFSLCLRKADDRTYLFKATPDLGVPNGLNSKYTVLLAESRPQTSSRSVKSPFRESCTSWLQRFVPQSLTFAAGWIFLRTEVEKSPSCSAANEFRPD